MCFYIDFISYIKNFDSSNLAQMKLSSITNNNIITTKKFCDKILCKTKKFKNESIIFVYVY